MPRINVKCSLNLCEKSSIHFMWNCHKDDNIKTLLLIHKKKTCEPNYKELKAFHLNKF